MASDRSALGRGCPLPERPWLSRQDLAGCGRVQYQSRNGKPPSAPKIQDIKAVKSTLYRRALGRHRSGDPIQWRSRPNSGYHQAIAEPTTRGVSAYRMERLTTGMLDKLFLILANHFPDWIRCSVVGRSAIRSIANWSWRRGGGKQLCHPVRRDISRQDFCRTIGNLTDCTEISSTPFHLVYQTHEGWTTEAPTPFRVPGAKIPRYGGGSIAGCT